MITKDECLSILVKLEDNGVDINPYMKKLLISKEVPLEVLQFISKNRGLEATNFYEMLRKKHNQHKSSLYINILKEAKTADDIVITLSCFLTQTLLYNNKLKDKTTFLKEIRAEEVSRALHAYLLDGTLDLCLTVLKLVKSDLLVLEYIAGRRELAQ